MRASSLCVLLALCGLGASWLIAPSTAWAQSSAPTLRVMVTLPGPAKDASKDAEAAKRRRQTLALVTVQTAKRIKRRLLAAGVGEVNMVTLPRGEISIQTAPAKSAQWMAQVVVPAGRLGLHEQVEQASIWTQLATSLPKGVQLRQGATDSYLWSASHQTLQGFLSRLALADRTVSLLPGESGWRSVMWRGRLASEADIASATLKTSRLGVPFVAVSFKARANQAWRASPATSFVISLDGEAIEALGPAPKQIEPVAALNCTGSLSAQRDCAAQIVGRLSVPIPLNLIVLPPTASK